MANILIVDDEELIREALKQIVERAGHQAQCAQNGSEAMQMIANLLPDLIITDLIMPETEGLELIRSLKSSIDPIKIIAISGGSRYLNPDSQLQAAEFLGADLCFSKPIDTNEFIHSVNLLLEM